MLYGTTEFEKEYQDNISVNLVKLILFQINRINLGFTMITKITLPQNYIDCWEAKSVLNHRFLGSQHKQKNKSEFLFAKEVIPIKRI